MRLKELEGELQPLKGFAKSKRELEQYVTSAHLGSRMVSEFYLVKWGMSIPPAAP